MNPTLNTLTLFCFKPVFHKFDSIYTHIELNKERSIFNSVAILFDPIYTHIELNKERSIFNSIAI